jgi:hypothetical protein
MAGQPFNAIFLIHPGCSLLLVMPRAASCGTYAREATRGPSGSMSLAFAVRPASRAPCETVGRPTAWHAGKPYVCGLGAVRLVSMAHQTRRAPGMPRSGRAPQGCHAQPRRL